MSCPRPNTSRKGNGSLRDWMKPTTLVTRMWVTLMLSGLIFAGYYLLFTSKYVTIGQQTLKGLMMMVTSWGTPHHLSHQEISQRFQQRRTILQQACKQYNQSARFQPIPLQMVTLGADWPLRNVSLRYCPIQKTGSRTWRQIFDSLKPLRKELGTKVQPDLSGKAEEEVKFLFVRDPYSRLLSAYVDKLFSPDKPFWERTGKYIIQNFRSEPSNASLRCGHDVTFLEYVRYVIHSQETFLNRDRHFVPTHDHCDVCNISYTYIGHLETLVEDMTFLFEIASLPKDKIPKKYDYHTIDTDARWMLHRMEKDFNMCITMHEAYLRLWKKWHIRGIISKKEPLPVTAKEAETISIKNFVKLALKALYRSDNKAERKRQKTEALREAFASIPPEDKLQVQDMLMLDFALFGFDPQPEAVFPTVADEQDGSYSYFDLSEAAGAADGNVFDDASLLDTGPVRAGTMTSADV